MKKPAHIPSSASPLGSRRPTASELSELVKDEVSRRLEGLDDVDDGRRGFGTIYVTGKLQQLGGDWRDAVPSEYPSWLNAQRYHDYPFQVRRHLSFATRCIVANELAAVANTIFDPEGVHFAARPLEVVEAGPDRPAGLYRGDEADILAMDLFIGVPMPKIIDLFVSDEFHPAFKRGHRPHGAFMHRLLGHRAGRINAARAMLGYERLIKIPAPSALQRRIVALEDLERDRMRRDLLEV